MKQFNETPYGVVAFVREIEPEEPFITIVVTGNFALVPDKPCEALPKEAQAKPQKACYYADKIGNSRFCDGDVVTFKPRADCLLVGEAHAPNGKPATQLDVEFGVGAMRKKLSVFGDRHWVRQLDGSYGISKPQPFTRLPIRNELAHGGATSGENKHGIGFGDPEQTGGKPLPVANIVPAGHQAIHWNDDEAPAGFGALATDHGQRARLRGTFDSEWLYRRKPFPPKDFDPAFFNSARADQQVDGYLAGDEALYLKHLHPTLPEFHGQLPGTRVRLFVHHLEDHEKPVLEEVRCVLDTCLVNLYDGIVRLCWRGTMASGPSKSLDQIAALMVAEERIDAPENQDVFFQRFRRHIEDAKPHLPDPMRTTDEQEKKIAAINAKAIADMVAALKQHGADPDLIAEVGKQDTAEKAVDVLARAAEKLRERFAGPAA